jgi:hypothetical protein
MVGLFPGFFSGTAADSFISVRSFHNRTLGTVNGITAENFFTEYAYMMIACFTN